MEPREEPDGIPYPSDPLDSTSQQFRLLKVHPGAYNDAITCELEIRSLFDYQSSRYPMQDVIQRFHESDGQEYFYARLHLPLPFEALSYTWGDSSLRRFITVEGMPCFEVSLSLHAALRRMRLLDWDRILWIDQICINQDDFAERDQQVRLMSRIYKLASDVVVWIGEADPEIPKVNNFAIARRDKFGLDPLSPHHQETRDAIGLAQSCVASPQGGASSGWLEVLSEINRSSAARLREAAVARFVGSASTRTRSHDTDKRIAALSDAVKLLSSVWWERAWILQEIIMASVDPVVMFGAHEVSWEDFVGIFDQLMISEKVSARDLAILLIAWDRRTTGMLHFVDLVRKTTCGDPKDKVYCLLGLMSSTEANLIRSRYARSCTEVYADATCAAIVAGQSLRALCWAGPAGCPNGGPSWVIDFATPKSTWCRWANLNPKRWYTRDWNDDLRVRSDESWKKLAIHGARFDKITHVFNFRNEAQLRNTVLDSTGSSSGKGFEKMLSDLPNHDPYCLVTTGSSSRAKNTACNCVKLEDRRADLIRKSCAQWPGTCFGAIFAAWESASRDRIVLSTFPESIAWKATRAVEVDAKIKSHMTISNGSGMSFFTTSLGFLGFASQHAVAGDSVILFPGSTAPAILHPVGSEYQFQGFAYVHGVMEEELLVRSPTARFEAEEFVIV